MAPDTPVAEGPTFKDLPRSSAHVPNGWRRVARWIPLAAIVGLVSCAPGPTGPRLYSVTGHVKLTGFLVDASGRFAGTKVVGDADGVPVELVYGTRVVARATTVGGVYHFTGVAPGGYFVQTNPVSIIADFTNDLTVANSDLAVGDTLRLASVGDLTPTPNPIGTGAFIYFDIPDTQYVEVKVLNMGGEPVNTLFKGDLPGGLNYAFWGGRDSTLSPAPGKNFWVTFVSGEDQRAHLIFK